MIDLWFYTFGRVKKARTIPLLEMGKKDSDIFLSTILFSYDKYIPHILQHKS
jgi:hypothetical protein